MQVSKSASGQVWRLAYLPTCRNDKAMGLGFGEKQKALPMLIGVILWLFASGLWPHAFSVGPKMETGDLCSQVFLAGLTEDQVTGQLLLSKAQGQGGRIGETQGAVVGAVKPTQML
jgi:hypothetical protein